MPDQRSNLMLAMYAGIEAVAEGKIAEVELEHRIVANREGVESEEILTVSVRRSVKLIQAGGGQVEGG